MVIHFGTSGWRARIAEEFTFANVRRAVTAIAAWLHETGAARRGVYVGYDTRFLSERFAAIAASTLADHRVPAVLSPTPVPTPAVAWAIVSGRRAGGVNITASHNPPAWNGLKFSTHRGAPAPPGITRRIEELAAHPAGPGAVPADASAGGPARRSAVRTHDIRQAYFKQLSGLVRLRAIRRARLRIACDLRHGASIGFLDGILRHATSSLKPIHDRPHPEFGGLGPDCGETQLAELARLVRRSRLHLGLATDGDGDRFGIVDRGGHFLPPNLFLALLADYLLEERRVKGGVGRTVATTHLIDAVCAYHGRPVFETPVGFKFLGEHLLSRRAFLACEESAGMSVAGHVPEKDGILAGLLAAEMVAVRRKPLRDQVRDLFRKVGPLHSRRIDYHTDPAGRDRLARRLEEIPSTMAGRRIVRFDTTDGRKMVFEDGAWLLLRPSGTEPLIRCYAEARVPRDLDSLLAAARALMQ
ncbi:MAG: phosphoglucomutase/phosphomannomutase family protein [Candidatus Polarisedimenticolia bacterium]